MGTSGVRLAGFGPQKVVVKTRDVRFSSKISDEGVAVTCGVAKSRRRSNKGIVETFSRGMA